MRLLLDSANLNDIAKIMNTSAIHGVTTNPSLMAKEDKCDYTEHLIQIAQRLNSSNVFRRHLSVETITLDPAEMIDQAIEYNDRLKCFKNVDLFIKIPVTLDNLPVISKLNELNIKVNATACMMFSQTKLAIDAGADITSYFYNRMKDGGDRTPETEIRKTAAYINTIFPPTKPIVSYLLSSNPVATSVQIKKEPPAIICGSIRKPEDISKCWSSGSEYVTASLKMIELLMSHPQTDKAIKGFQEDIDKWLE